MGKTSRSTVVICCAGMGTRLGIGTTKALITIGNKPLIVRQLELLQDYDDVRVVVGYQAKDVIDVVTKIRKDIMFAFNYDYKITGTLFSMCKGLIRPREEVVIMDGDFLVEPKDFNAFMNVEDECVAYTMNISAEPVYMKLNRQGYAVGFSKDYGTVEWSGLAKLKSSHISDQFDYIYEMIQQILPIRAIQINSIDVDTYDDYDRAVQWWENGYSLPNTYIFERGKND